MDRHIRLIYLNVKFSAVFLMLIAFCLVDQAYAVTVVNPLSIGNYQLISKQRVGRTTYNYTFRADITNTGSTEAQGVRATLKSLSPDTVVVDDKLIFGDVPAGTTVSSADTFTISQDRQYPFNPQDLSWEITQGGDDVVLQWDNAALQAIRDTHPGPPMVARALAIVHTAIYDAWTAYDPIAVGTRLGGTLRRPPQEYTSTNKDQAISFAAYRALVDLFPSEKPMFDSLMHDLGYNPADNSVDTNTPTGIGNVAATAVINFRHQDGSNQLGGYADYTGYVPINDPDHIIDPNRWQPLRVPDGHGGFVIQSFVGPQWQNVIPFALTSASQFRPPAVPFVYDPAHGPTDPINQDYYNQALEVINYSADLTDEQKVIAEYWADGPHSELPPGHWALFAQFISHRDGHRVDDDVKMFFAMTNAILDASIVAWDAKRVYDSVRPVTAIHFLFAGQQILAWAGPYQGVRLIDGADWEPYQAATVVTPPFPEYFSGHSIFSAAGAEILKSYTGSDAFGNAVTISAGSSRVEPGLVPAQNITLSWPTFSEAADEAGISRRYGGIHFIRGDLDARAAGRLVGAQAWAKAQTYFDGTAPSP